MKISYYMDDIYEVLDYDFNQVFKGTLIECHQWLDVNHKSYSDDRVEQLEAKVNELEEENADLREELKEYKEASDWVFKSRYQKGGKNA